MRRDDGLLPEDHGISQVEAQAGARADRERVAPARHAADDGSPTRKLEVMDDLCSAKEDRLHLSSLRPRLVDDDVVGTQHYVPVPACMLPWQLAELAAGSTGGIDRDLQVGRLAQELRNAPAFRTAIED